MKGRTEYSAVVPVYNSEKTLFELHRRLAATLAALSADYEIILIDDASTDDSWQTMRKIRKTDPKTLLIRLKSNSGQTNAALCGIRAAKGEYVITLDDDLQEPPEEISKLLAKLAEGYDAAYGQWRQSGQLPLNKLLSDMRKIILGAVNPHAAKSTSFRVLRRGVAEKVGKTNTRHPHLGSYVSWQTNNIGYTDVANQSRRQGRTNYTPAKTLKIAVDILLAGTGITRILPPPTTLGYAIAESEGLE